MLFLSLLLHLVVAVILATSILSFTLQHAAEVEAGTASPQIFEATAWFWIFAGIPWLLCELDADILSALGESYPINSYTLQVYGLQSTWPYVAILVIFYISVGQLYSLYSMFKHRNAADSTD